MAKTGEIAYLSNLASQRGEQAVRHALGKPFTDVNCAGYLAEMAAILALLPPPPGRILDLGCGTGWTSLFFAKTGYDVTGLDIAPDMIRVARELSENETQKDLQFVTADYEEFDGAAKFDAVVFFDSLHHAVDEIAALRCAWRALKPGGLCVASEPGSRHGKSAAARQAMLLFNVTEKGMPPLRIIRLARRIGFRSFHVYPHAFRIHREVFPRLYAPNSATGDVHAAAKIQKLLRFGAWLATAPWRILGRTSRLAIWNEFGCWASGITVMVK